MDINTLIKKGTFARTYRKCNLKSSLNPAIAYTLNILAGLEKDDRVLDPCCGSATILIERQLLMGSKFCLGIDIYPKALSCAKENIEAAKIEVELKHADIKDLKFPEGFFTKIISNLPYGIHAGSREKNIILYRFLAQSSEKWLKKGGKVVFLTQTKKLLWNSFATIKGLKFVSEEKLILKGLSPSVFIFEKI